MATPWAFEEDFIVCDFYFHHLTDWKQHLDELMNILRERGFNREKNFVRMRIQNFQYLYTGSTGLSNAANQSKRIYEVLSQYNANSKANLKNYIQSTYSGEPAIGSAISFDQEQILSPLDLNLLTTPQQNVHKLVFRLPQAPTFKEVLFGFISQKGFKKHSDVYNSCFVKRDTFNAIKKGKNNGVSKRTVMQFCFGLKLNYDEAVVLMASAGYAFAPSNLTDVIVEYYLKRQIHDIFEVNISLYDSGADLLF